MAEKLKGIANEAFKRKEYDEAVSLYSKALKEPVDDSKLRMTILSNR
jgi:hypothetical protein